jgi:hypothetical protein
MELNHHHCWGAVLRPLVHHGRRPPAYAPNFQYRTNIDSDKTCFPQGGSSIHRLGLKWIAVVEPAPYSSDHGE